MANLTTRLSYFLAYSNLLPLRYSFYRNLTAMDIETSTAKGKSSETPVKYIHQLQQGITGSDLTLPYFDGSSQNSDDHFIDLDTDSMEREPDVRVYFWMVGSEVLDTSEVPIDRVAHDSHLVRTGREWLRDYRDKGCG
jgi:hypothetical protein